MSYICKLCHCTETERPGVLSYCSRIARSLPNVLKVILTRHKCHSPARMLSLQVWDSIVSCNSKLISQSTGGSRGVGAQIVRLSRPFFRHFDNWKVLDLAQEGVSVLFNYTSPDSKSKADAVVESVAKLNNGAKVYAIQLDVALPDVGPKLLEAYKQHFGQAALLALSCSQCCSFYQCLFKRSYNREL